MSHVPPASRLTEKERASLQAEKEALEKELSDIRRADQEEAAKEARKKKKSTSPSRAPKKTSLALPHSSGQHHGRGMGKGGKGLGKGGAVRHRRAPRRDNIAHALTTSAVRRLARKGGVKRIAGQIAEEVRGLLHNPHETGFLDRIIRDAVLFTEHARRKTVTVGDVALALKRNGRTLYGYGNA